MFANRLSIHDSDNGLSVDLCSLVDYPFVTVIMVFELLYYFVCGHTFL